VQNNAILTWQLARIAAERRVPQLLLISTDKAANPRSILGASKRVAEQAIVRWSSHSTRCTAIRLVNVLGSTGSVVPLFLEQIRHGGPLTITHPDAARYFLTLKDTIRLILTAAALPDEGVLIPKLPEPVRITELARVLLRHAPDAKTNSIRMEYTALRPGEKLVEELLSSNEFLRPTNHPCIDAITSSPLSADALDRALLHLRDTVQRRDLPVLLETLCQLVPDYQPSSTLCPAGQMAHD
jgi:FlaA1/EpsC-like NDP-sugar epimerase